MQSPSWNAKNPWIFTKKSVFMQRIADRVRNGCTLFLQGQSHLEKVPFLAQKLLDRYPLNLTAMQASRRRKSGGGTYTWVGYYEPEHDLVHWVLLLDPGQVIDDTDKWLSVTQERVKITGYELVRLNRTGASAPSWTWRYTRLRMDQIRTAFVSAIRGRRDLDFAQLAHSTWRSPGFAGVREQVKKLRQLIVSEWKRARSEAEVMPDLPKQIGYVRRLPDVGSVWSEIMKKEKSQ